MAGDKWFGTEMAHKRYMRKQKQLDQQAEDAIGGMQVAATATLMALGNIDPERASASAYRTLTGPRRFGTIPWPHDKTPIFAELAALQALRAKLTGQHDRIEDLMENKEN